MIILILVKKLLKLGFFLVIPQPYLRSKTPDDFIVTHSDEEEVGVTSLTVFCDDEDAKVTLWNGDSLIS